VEVLARLKGVRVSVEISTEAECFRHRSSYRAVGCGCSGAPASQRTCQVRAVQEMRQELMISPLWCKRSSNTPVRGVLSALR